MDALEEFLAFHIEKLTTGEGVPVDLRRVAERAGATVEEREMIPEAAIDTGGGLFRIYLQSNFKNMPGAAVRNRFSLAHEIGHTLFIDRGDGQSKPRKDSPRGDHLEMACNRAAGLILVPTKVLQRVLREQENLDAQAVTALAVKFEVSLTVMLRRLHDLGTFDGDWVLVLTRRSGEGFTLEYSPYPPWLKSHLTKPLIGQKFHQWFGARTASEGILVRTGINGVLEAEQLDITKSKTIFTLRLRSAQTLVLW